jgi:hypothetical protein
MYPQPQHHPLGKWPGIADPNDVDIGVMEESDVLAAGATRTIILAIRSLCELWCRVTEARAEGSKGFRWFMLAANWRFRAQNTSPETAEARTPRDGQITWLAGHFRSRGGEKL